MNQKKFNFDYSKTLWMKMFLAKPDWERKTSDVLINFEQALEIIRMMDNITQGIQKIVYLVGWQGLGHDDCYPEMEIINPYLKRECDATPRDSFMWLYEEAKKYNTVISVHGNIADEYDANQSHPEFVEASAITKYPDGTPAVIEVFYGRNAYKTSYKQYWESGLFKKYFDRFCEVIPVREAGTIHLDNFCIAENFGPRTEMHEQDEARNKMLDYIIGLGIDVTSEYTYREMPLRSESNHPIRKYYEKCGAEIIDTDWHDAPVRTLGRIPAVWWMSNMDIEDCINIQASEFSGYLNVEALRNVFYGTVHGEDIWMNNGIEKDVWVPMFIKQFCTMQVPYAYLNRYKRLSYTGNSEDGYVVTFSDGVETCGNKLSITKNGIELKNGYDVILPLTDDNKIFIAYSENGKDGEWNIPDAVFDKAKVYNISAEGNEYLFDIAVKDKKIALNLKAKQAVAIIAY